MPTRPCLLSNVGTSTVESRIVSGSMPLVLEPEELDAMPKRFDPRLRVRRMGLVTDRRHEHLALTAAVTAVARQEGVARESVRRRLTQVEVDDGTRPGHGIAHRSQPSCGTGDEPGIARLRPPSNRPWIDGTIERCDRTPTDEWACARLVISENRRRGGLESGLDDVDRHHPPGLRQPTTLLTADRRPRSVRPRPAWSRPRRRPAPRRRPRPRAPPPRSARSAGCGG